MNGRHTARNVLLVVAVLVVLAGLVTLGIGWFLMPSRASAETTVSGVQLDSPVSPSSAPASSMPPSLPASSAASEAQPAGTASSPVAMQDLRLQQLENALNPATPLEAAQMWARSEKERNGALRFALLSAPLRAQYEAKYAELGWSLGTSSPWVASYEVKQESSGSGSYTYAIDYTWTDSTGAKTHTTEHVTVQKTAGGGSSGSERWSIVSGDHMSPY